MNKKGAVDDTTDLWITFASALLFIFISYILLISSPAGQQDAAIAAVEDLDYGLEDLSKARQECTEVVTKSLLEQVEDIAESIEEDLGG